MHIWGQQSWLVKSWLYNRTALKAVIPAIQISWDNICHLASMPDVNIQDLNQAKFNHSLLCAQYNDHINNNIKVNYNLACYPILWLTLLTGY